MCFAQDVGPSASPGLKKAHKEAMDIIKECKEIMYALDKAPIAPDPALFVLFLFPSFHSSTRFWASFEMCSDTLRHAG